MAVSLTVEPTGHSSKVIGQEVEVKDDTGGIQCLGFLFTC